VQKSGAERKPDSSVKSVTFVVQRTMAITLTPEQQEWLAAHVASGDFPSSEEAARQLIDDRITELELENDDLAWAKPYVDEAIAAVERGEYVTLEEHRAHMAALLASFDA
jgi:antitoxin ParD1/3/4